MTPTKAAIAQRDAFDRLTDSINALHAKLGLEPPAVDLKTGSEAPSEDERVDRLTEAVTALRASVDTLGSRLDTVVALNESIQRLVSAPGAAQPQPPPPSQPNRPDAPRTEAAPPASMPSVGAPSPVPGAGPVVAPPPAEARGAVEAAPEGLDASESAPVTAKPVHAPPPPQATSKAKDRDKDKH